MRRPSILKDAFLGLGVLVLPLAFLSIESAGNNPVPGPLQGAAAKPSKKNRYLGVKACRSCHKAKNKGNQYQVWLNGPHSKAYKVLGTEEAKKVAAKLKIADPQKSPKCLKCHVTAFGVDKKLKKKTLKLEDGVGCEVCHGPGEKHRKGRMRAVMSGKVDPKVFTPPPPGEIVTRPPVKVCLGCHNPESPTFKKFCFVKAYFKIVHPDPRKKRDPREWKAMKAQIKPGCKCRHAECGGYVDLKKLEKKKGK